VYEIRLSSNYVISFCYPRTGKSGFMQFIRGAMERDGKQYRAYVLDNKVPKEEAQKWPNNGKARVVYFMEQMEEYRKKSAENKKQKQEEEEEEEDEDEKPN
jgi:hypothetical protein